MSAINGDKSRHQINRKRTVLQRMKIRQMVADRAKAPGSAPAATPATPARTSARSR